MGSSLRMLPYGSVERISRLLIEALEPEDIRRLLGDCAIPHRRFGALEWEQLDAALRDVQTRDGAGNAVVRLVQESLHPSRWIGRGAEHEQLRAALNEVLAFDGLQVDGGATLKEVPTARTLAEAQQRAHRLRYDIEDRRLHPDLLAACRSELLAENWFHAVLEAVKSLAGKIRSRTETDLDGAALVDYAFSSRRNGYPPLAFNTLQSSSDISEQAGLVLIIKGLFQAFRNPAAHTPRVDSSIGEQDALDVLSTLSMLHRRVDSCAMTGALDAETMRELPAETS